MLLISPQVEMPKKSARAARHGARARHLRQHARRQDGAGQEGAQVLPATTSTPDDRFALINFATTVNTLPRQAGRGEHATSSSRPRSGSTSLEATGGTAINDALDDGPGDAAATTRAGRSPSSSSPTASRPSARRTRTRSSRTSPRKNTANTRIFTFGVGDDVNAALLDQLADNDAGRQHLRPPGRGHRGQGDEPVRQDQPPGADQPEADDRRQRAARTRSTRRSCPTCSTAASSSCSAATPGSGPRGRSS